MKTTILALATTALSGSALAETIVIGHFGSPTPMQAAAAEGRFEEATGWDIEWRRFAAGTDVIAAMASGDVVLAELGSSPLAIAASQGVDLQLVMLAQVLGEAESLIVAEDSGIEALADLKGKRVAVPVGSTAHYSLMGALEHEGIPEADVTIMSMPPEQIAAAWEQDAIDAAFIWQPVQAQILQTGERLLGADQTAEWGYPTFDGWVADREWAAENADALASFLRVMDEANRAYIDDPASFGPDSEVVATIAERTGADPEQIPTILEGFTFLPASEQMSEAWLGGQMVDAMRGTAEFLQAAGRIDSVAEDYSGFVNTGPLEAAAGGS